MHVPCMFSILKTVMRSRRFLYGSWVLFCHFGFLIYISLNFRQAWLVNVKNCISQKAPSLVEEDMLYKLELEVSYHSLLFLSFRLVQHP